MTCAFIPQQRLSQFSENVKARRKHLWVTTAKKSLPATFCLSAIVFFEGFDMDLWMTEKLFIWHANVKERARNSHKEHKRIKNHTAPHTQLMGCHRKCHRVAAAAAAMLFLSQLFFILPSAWTILAQQQPFVWLYHHKRWKGIYLLCILFYHCRVPIFQY